MLDFRLRNIATPPNTDRPQSIGFEFFVELCPADPDLIQSLRHRVQLDIRVHVRIPLVGLLLSSRNATSQIHRDKPYMFAKAQKLTPRKIRV
jgi:hypothetical protein